MRPPAVLLLSVALPACGSSVGGPAPSASADPSEIPAAAAEVGTDLFMVPAGRDAGGCPYFVMRSRGQATLEAIFYRTRTGDYSTNRAEAAC